MRKLYFAVVLILTFIHSLNAQTEKGKTISNFSAIVSGQSGELFTHHNKLSEGFNDFKKLLVSSNKQNKKDTPLIYRPSFVYFESGIARVSFTYNNQGDMLTNTSEILIDNEWVTSYRGTNTYDSNGNRLMEIFENWENGNWSAVDRRTFKYDLQGNLLTSIAEDCVNGIWQNRSQDTYSYDSLGVRRSLLVENWVDVGWVNISKFTFEYSEIGNLLSSLVESWENGQWVKTVFGKISYNSFGNISTVLIEDYKNGAWENSSLDTYSYDTNENLTTLLSENWDSEGWVNYCRISYEYDSHNNRISGLCDGWDGTNWAPGIGFLEIDFGMKDQSYGFLDHFISVEYKLITNVEKTESNPNDFVLSQNYPNPFNPTTTINFSLPNSEFVTLKVYDVLGREITSLVNEELNAGQHTKIFNANNLSSGVYFYKLQAGKFSETKKMMLVR